MSYVKKADRVNLILGVAGALLSLCAACEVAYGDNCGAGYKNGYKQSALVPCNGGTCVALSLYPTNAAGYSNTACTNTTLLLCDNINDSAVRFTATVAASWFKCTDASSSTYPSCTDTCSACMNSYLYKGTSCSAGDQCTANVVPFKSCGSVTSN